MGFFDVLQRKVQGVDNLDKKTLELFAKSWLNTKPLNIEEMKGKVILVEFAAIETETKETIHQMNLWNQMFPPAEFQMISIYSPENKVHEIEKVKLFLNKHKANYPVMLDDSFKTADLFKAQFKPSFYLFDKHGRLRHRILSGKDLDRVGSAMMKLMFEKG